MSLLNRVQAVWVGMLTLSVPFLAGAGYLTSPVPAGMSMQMSGLTAVMEPDGDGAAKASPATKPSVKKPNEPFAIVKARADKVTDPTSGVFIWQSYIENGATGEDLDKANAELKMWSERADDDAAIINKKWVGGKERKQVEEKVAALVGEFRALAKKSQMVDAIEKLKEAAKVWPENYQVTFELGFIALDKGDYKDALTKYEFCARLAPNSPAVLNNLGLCYLFQKPQQIDKGIATLVKSVKAKDTNENVGNLALGLGLANPQALKGSKYKEAKELVSLLESHHQLKNGPALMSLREDSGVDTEKGGGRNDKDQVLGNGSGFVFTADGYILTNKHVGGAGSGVLIKFNDGTQKVGEVVVIDDEQDLALIKCKSDKPFSYVKFAVYDNPPDGADVVVMGFPLGGQVGWAMKTTTGIVAVGSNSGMTSDVTLDVRVNPGNSGGPVYDRFGNIIAIIAQKTLSDGQKVDTYGLAISAGRVRRFLKKNKIAFETVDDPGTEPLRVQQISERNRMATVCIMIVGKPPTESERKEKEKE